MKNNNSKITYSVVHHKNSYKAELASLFMHRHKRVMQ